MLARIEFKSRKFKTTNLYKKGVYIKPKFKDLYRWLSKKMSQSGIRNQIISLDDHEKNRDPKVRFGNTLLVQLDVKYQLVWGWIPSTSPQSKFRGTWALDIFKNRSSTDKWLMRKKLNIKDPLIKHILEYLDDPEFEEVVFLTEKEFKR